MITRYGGFVARLAVGGPAPGRQMQGRPAGGSSPLPAVPAYDLSAAPQPDGFTARTNPLINCTPAGSEGAPQHEFSGAPS